jgi:hypothetical protein
MRSAPRVMDARRCRPNLPPPIGTAQRANPVLSYRNEPVEREIQALEAKAKTQRFKKPLNSQLFAYHLGYSDCCWPHKRIINKPRNPVSSTATGTRTLKANSPNSISL